MAVFKTIDYGRMNYEALRNFHSVNRSGFLSIEYRYTLSMVYPLQDYFNGFDTWRRAKKIIAQCKWTIGQVTNVLNYFFDNNLKRIYLTQQRLDNLFAPVIAYESITFAPVIAEESTAYAPSINDTATVLAEVTIHVPSDVYSNPLLMSQLISVVDQIKITGFVYIIVVIP